MRKLVSGLAVTTFLALSATGAQAQVQVGPTLALHDEFDFGIGATVGARMPQIGENFGLLADFVVYFPDTGNYFEINGNLTYEFPLENSSVAPFLLGGLNIGRRSIADQGDTEVGINLGGGLTFDAGSFRPAAGLKVDVGAHEGLVVFITLPFELSS